MILDAAAAGARVLLGNASPDAVDASDVTVADNNHGGCAEAVYDYLLRMRQRTVPLSHFLCASSSQASVIICA